jgi:hypothetical protein
VVLFQPAGLVVYTQHAFEVTAGSRDDAPVFNPYSLCVPRRRKGLHAKVGEMERFPMIGLREDCFVQDGTVCQSGDDRLLHRFFEESACLQDLLFGSNGDKRHDEL